MSNVVALVKNEGTMQLFDSANNENIVQWDKESQFAIQSLQSNDYLAKIARNNPTSIQNAVVNVAAMGVTLNPAMKHAYLVPRKGAVCLDISYMGLIDIACSTGSIRWVQALIVRQNDDFKITGVSSEPIHTYSPFGNRGDIVGVYCVAKTSDGDFLTTTMSVEDVHKVRARSESFKSNSGPWLTDEEEMFKKTVVKRAQKYWPKVERLAAAIEYQNTQMGEGIELEPVMRHYSDEEKQAMQSKSEAELSDSVQTFIDQMEMSENERQLKTAFQSAFKATREHKEMNQQVQQIYVKNKTRLGL